MVRCDLCQEREGVYPLYVMGETWYICGECGNSQILNKAEEEQVNIV